jgi:hypothetical protein
MNNKKPALFVVFILIAFLGFWQFSQGVRSVDVIGLFASGMLAGAALTGLLLERRQH